MFSPSSLLHSLPRHPPVYVRQLSQTAGKQRIALSLYRQVLRWCNETDENIPLSFLVPPVYMTAPQIDEKRLLSLSDEEKSKFPASSIIESGQITCPIRNSTDARKLFRAVFRLNREPTGDADTQKKRITIAFEAIRSLNELSQDLNRLKQNRAKHVLRDGIEFRVGQVVKHKLEDWRGIVVGWQRVEGNDSDELQQGQPTCLTRKSYELDAVDAIRYSILMDSGDAYYHYSKRREPINLSQSNVFQSDLQLVKDKSLRRIRNTISAQYFDRFNTVTGMFIPNESLAYEYPEDLDSYAVGSQRATIDSTKAAVQIIAGVEDVGDHLRRIILDYTSAPESRKLNILSQYLDRVLKIASGDVFPIKDRFAAGGVSKIKHAGQYLKHLISLSEDIGELLWQRRRYTESASSFDFSIGDVVKHKKYGFRGVIVGSDPEPSFDVSRWDGLQDIKNPEMYPFYHIIPDQMDCIDAFGGGRPSRYVCQANLEICPMSERNIAVDMEPGWMYSSTEALFTPPDDVKFKYGGDLGDDGLTMQCLMELRGLLTRTFVSMRDPVLTGDTALDAIAEKLSVENLMDVLRYSEDMEISTAISDSLKEIWRAHINGDLKNQMDTAITALLGGKIERALALFTDLIDEDPNYAEAWNKAATCEFMLGNLDASLAAAQKTLEIIPTHFQAQNGLGLVYYEKKALPLAVDSFRKTLKLDPWSPVSARLSLCIERLEKWRKSPAPKAI